MFTCPFCKGSGADPYVEAIPEVECPICRGETTVEVVFDPEGGYLLHADELVRFQPELFAGPLCEHVRGKLWAEAESAHLDALAAARVRIVGALLP